MINKFKIVFLVFFILIFCLATGVLSYSDVRYHGGQYRDPLKSLLPKVPPEVPSRPLNLDIQGLIWDTDRPSAIINGQVLNIGDSIDGAEVLSITKEGVLILFAGEKFLIKIGKVKK